MFNFCLCRFWRPTLSTTQASVYSGDEGNRTPVLHICIKAFLQLRFLKTILVIIKFYQLLVLHLSVPKQVLLDFLSCNSRRSIIYIYKYVVYYFVVLLCFLSLMQSKPNIPIAHISVRRIVVTPTYTNRFIS